MKQNVDWTKKYYSEAAQAKIEERKKLWTPELQKKGTSDWNELIKDVEIAIATGEKPTGETAKPVAIGGGTYARAMKNGVAFGPETASTDFKIHQPNEFASSENIELQFSVYKAAIKELSK